MTPRSGGLDANRRDPSPNGHGERTRTPLFGANQGWSHGNGDSGGKNISDWNTIKWRPRGHRDNDDVAGGRGREKNWKSEKSRPTGFRAGREGGAVAVRNTNGETMQRGAGALMHARARPFGFSIFKSDN